MTETVHLHDRCLAMQLSKMPPPPLVRVRSHPSPLPPIPPGHQSSSKSLPTQYQQNGFRTVGYASLNRRVNAKSPSLASQPINPSDDVSRLSADSRNGKQDSKSDTEQHCSTESGSPTPTNAYPPIIPKIPSPKQGQNGILNGYQDGFLLFQSWVSANLACVWDEELVKAVRSVHFVGLLVGGFVLVGGSARVLASICHAHSRALLCAPPGWIIIMLGEVQDCSVNVVIRGQFTPLGDALCWVIHNLTRLGQTTDQESIRKSLLSHFTSMVPPDAALIHAAISDLIRQRKVFHSINGYGIVKRETYSPAPAPTPVSVPETVPRLLSTSEALTKAHGDAETVTDGRLTHTAVQTDLVDLIRGPRPESMIITGKPDTSASNCFQRSGSLRTDRRNFTFLNVKDTPTTANKYEAEDRSDITITGADRISVFSKFLRPSTSRKRLATFSAQFPPPTWKDSASTEKHFHSVATQTRTAKYSTSPDSCWLGDTYFIYRSSTLPRRPSRPVANATSAPNGRSQSASPSHAKLSENKLNRSSRDTSSMHSSTRQDQSSKVPLTSKPCGIPQPVNGHVKGAYKAGSWHLSKLEQHENTPPGARPSVDERCPVGYLRRRHIQNALHNTLPRNIGRRQCAPVEASYSKSDVNLEQIEKDPKNANGEAGNGLRSLAGFHKRTIDYAAKRQILQPHGGNFIPKPSLTSEEHQYVKNEPKKDRANMHLDLASMSMNNSKKVLNSPPNADTFKSNGFLENFPSTAKASATDLTFKNLGYTDVDKSEKHMYTKDGERTKDDILSVSLSSPKSMSLIEKSLDVQNCKKDLNKSQLDVKDLSIKMNGSTKDIANGCDDEKTVKNFPSLSNLHFSSLAAQKILQGVSMNSIDTLVEVNLVAEKQKITEIVTNTDFGFV